MNNIERMRYTQIRRPPSTVNLPMLNPNPLGSFQSTAQGHPLVHPIPSQKPSPHLSPSLHGQEQVFVYCPVCSRDFSEFQTQYHAGLHETGRTSDFTFRDQNVPTQQNVPRKQVKAITSQYPLIEPLQFDTWELRKSPQQDRFILKMNRNYDKVDKSLFQLVPTKNLKHAGTQYPNRPIQPNPPVQIVSSPNPPPDYSYYRDNNLPSHIEVSTEEYSWSNCCTRTNKVDHKQLMGKNEAIMKYDRVGHHPRIGYPN